MLIYQLNCLLNGVTQLIKYKILSGDLIANLEDKVNEYLSSGWELQGGVCSSISVDYYGKVHKLYTQSLIKNEGG